MSPETSFDTIGAKTGNKDVVRTNFDLNNDQTPQTQTNEFLNPQTDAAGNSPEDATGELIMELRVDSSIDDQRILSAEEILECFNNFLPNSQVETDDSQKKVGDETAAKLKETSLPGPVIDPEKQSSEDRILQSFFDDIDAGKPFFVDEETRDQLARTFQQDLQCAYEK